ncbi:glycosyltransferase involved in cell wall biosynthesis [Thiogranum longum]|uniref:Glycosyltransferase involved in cell wall biosynthesis n=1 Tax=Thiogranum longum TaxID=1537524 RepID=A0A4V6NDB4_9GAMM|nr:glycosyltransferase family 4 protein [Thiogranum longum]TCK18186.1 glycosyltransferase involved in cell wall biosynthesis [Thiogranum longum]
MNILFCNYEYPPLGGGGGVINALLAEELATRHEVTVLTSQGLGLPAESVVNGVRVVRAPVFFRSQQAAANVPSMLAFLPMGIAAGKRLIKANRYDVINTHFVLPTGPVGAALARFGKLPHVLSVHGGDLYDPSKWISPHRHFVLRTWIKRLLRQADSLVGQSRNTIDNVHTYYDASLDVARIPLGIKRPAVDAARRADYGFTDDQVLLVTVGRLVARKAMDQLISVLKDTDRPDAHLVIIGSGPQEQALQQQSRELGVADRVHFMGQTDERDKFRLLQVSDIFVSTSQHEGFGLVYLEAMASGLPVVCYDYGGQTDFLTDGVTGHVVPLNDTALFTECCRKLISDREASQKISDRNLELVEDLYIENCARQYEQLFEDLIKKQQVQ